MKKNYDLDDDCFRSDHIASNFDLATASPQWDLALLQDLDLPVSGRSLSFPVNYGGGYKITINSRKKQ